MVTPIINKRDMLFTQPYRYMVASERVPENFSVDCKRGFCCENELDFDVFYAVGVGGKIRNQFVAIFSCEFTFPGCQSSLKAWLDLNFVRRNVPLLDFEKTNFEYVIKSRVGHLRSAGKIGLHRGKCSHLNKHWN